MSLEMSKIYFSENVSRDMRKIINDESGIMGTRDLGEKFENACSSKKNK